MGESISHISLVNDIEAYVLEHFVSKDSSCIFIDSPENAKNCVPPIINGYRPDLYVPSFGDKGLIIGEAKTWYDLEKSHTMNQLDAFLRACSDTKNSIFIFAVPWDRIKLAKMLINKLKVKNSYKAINVIIMEKLCC